MLVEATGPSDLVGKFAYIIGFRQEDLTYMIYAEGCELTRFFVHESHLRRIDRHEYAPTEQRGRLFWTLLDTLKAKRVLLTIHPSPIEPPASDPHACA